MAESSSRKNRKRSYLDILEDEDSNKHPEKRVRFPKGKKSKPEQLLEEETEARRKARDAAMERSQIRSKTNGQLLSENYIDDGDEAQETYENDENSTEDGIHIEAFSLDREKEEGYFDADGNFVEYVREKEEKERKKLGKSIKELTEIMKQLKEITESKADDLRVIPFRPPVVEPECNFGNKDHLIDFNGSFFVRGFEEIKKKRKAVKELIELMKELKEIIESKPDDLVISFRREEKAPAVEPRNECNFGNKDHLIDLNGSFFVRGFDASLPREEIKKSLRKHFESRGFHHVKTVYVPITCATGLSFGYAFVEVQNCAYSNVLKLDGSRFEGGRILLVEYAKFKYEYSEHPDVEGCKRCAAYMPWLHRRRPFASAVPPPPRRNWRRRTVGTPYSQIGRFTANIARVFN